MAEELTEEEQARMRTFRKVGRMMLLVAAAVLGLLAMLPRIIERFTEAPESSGETIGRELNYRGLVETVYILVCAECGISALVAMLAWFAWHWLLSVRLMKKLRGTEWYFVAAGLFGGLAANYLQSVLEWVPRQQLNLICLMFVFALLSYLNVNWRAPVTARRDVAL